MAAAITHLSSQPLRVVVVEDQPLVGAHLAHLLERIPDIAVEATCENGLVAARVIPDVRPDLVLLDIEMPELSGFDLIEAIGVDRMPPVIFITAYDMYALKAFEVHALDYVLKPVSRGRLEEVIARARTRLGRLLPADIAAHLSALLNRPEVTATRDRFAVRAADRITFVRYDDVHWVEACGNYAILHVGDQQHTIREPLTALEARLGRTFSRIHRGTIVNLRRVRELRSAGKGEYDVILTDGSRHRVTRRFRPSLAASLSALD